MHNWEHPVGLYHRLVRQLHDPQPQGSPEGGAVCRKAKKITKDYNHTSHCLFTPLSSRRRGQYRCIQAGTERLKNSFYLKAIRLLNSYHEAASTRLCCPIYIDLKSLATLIMEQESNIFALLISYCMYILYSILLYFSLCHSDIAHPNHQIKSNQIYLYSPSYISWYLKVLYRNPD
jgi:hypothetical protein